MANEARITSYFTLRAGNVDYSGRPTSYQADVSEGRGPTPGTILVTVAGTDVDLSLLTTPGFCRIQNLDETNYISIGMWDPENSKFFPVLELLAGEHLDVRLARDIQEEYEVGTGTTGPNTNRLRIKASSSSCYVLVQAFEK